MKIGQPQGLVCGRVAQHSHLGASVEAEAFTVHWVKSISFWQPLQKCFLSNSSEKISASFPQSGQRQANDLRSLNCSNPGQCRGVVMAILS